ncbi:MAG TPA: hypothetical protein DET40_04755 [Lentisphaeria bacterium]|nr:MAG: hypothetical protein A2X45_13330 [Lentisphaerae bacterium GWF2_50_93]HCE42835.1 hypothetical protein [Lentisphaeria bacterium]
MRKTLILILLLYSATSCHSAEKCRIIYFLEKNCPEKCKEVDNIILPQLKELYGNKIEVVKKDLETPANFEALMAFELKYGVPPGEVPELYTTHGTAQKTDNIKKKLTGFIEAELSTEKPGIYADFFNKYLDSGQIGISAVGNIKSQPVAIKSPLKIYYFYKPGCRTCSRLDISMRYLAKKYPDQLKIFHSSITENASKVMDEALCMRYSVPDKLHLATPAVFFGRESFIGEKAFKNLDIVGKVAKAMETADKDPAPEFTSEELLKAERAITGRFDRISWTAVLSAGLIDGINPCAFVTIIFLLSYLALLKYGRKEIIFVGLSFTLSVFTTYLLIGLGFLKFVDYLQSLPFLTDLVYYSGAGLAAGIGILNLADYIKIRRGSVKDINLKLDDGLRRKINEVIRKNVRLSHYIVGTAVIGFSVSVLELACTGQTYLPTVLFIVNTQGLSMKALLMLISYNVAFIVPLVVVFMLFFVGVTDKQLSEWIRNHAGKIKLATGLVFIAIAVILLLLMK